MPDKFEGFNEGVPDDGGEDAFGADNPDEPDAADIDLGSDAGELQRIAAGRLENDSMPLPEPEIGAEEQDSKAETRTPETIAKALVEASANEIAEFCTKYGLAEPAEEPTSPAVVQKFSHQVSMGILRGNERCELKMPGQVVITSSLSYDQITAEETGVSSVGTEVPPVHMFRADIVMRAHDEREDEDTGNVQWSRPFCTYSLSVEAGELKKVVGDDSSVTVSTAGDEETQAFLGVLDRIAIASKMKTDYDAWLTRDQNLTESPETPLQKMLAFKPEVVHADIAQGVGYTSDDLQAFLEAHPGLSKSTEYIVPEIDGQKPGYRVRAEEAEGLPFARDDRDVAVVGEYLRDIRKEYGKLEEAGATVPPCAHFVVRDADTKKTLIFTATQDAEQAEPLAWTENRRPKPGHEEEHEQVVEIISNYLTTCLEDHSQIGFIQFPNSWRKGGVTDLNLPMLRHDFVSLQGGLSGLSGWLELLPQSPKVVALWEKTQVQLQWVHTISGYPDF